MVKMAGVLLFHLLGFLHYVLSIYYDVYYVKVPHKKRWDNDLLSGRLKFLTFWNMILQAVFFTICFLNDVIGTNENIPKQTPLIRRIKDIILPTLAFPLSMFVGTTFWGIYFVDRELVFPKILDQYFPAWLNHVMHTNIMLFVLIEMFTSFRKYPKRKLGLSIVTIFMLCYLIWMHIIYAYTNVWVYPILEVLNLPLRGVFFIGLFVYTIVLYVVGEKLNNLIWSRQLQLVKRE